jgi:hypothetical protein
MKISEMIPMPMNSQIKHKNIKIARITGLMR